MRRRSRGCGGRGSRRDAMLPCNINHIANIYDSVRYEGPNIELKADQINLNLITKKIDIYMVDNLDNVEIELNK